MKVKNINKLSFPKGLVTESNTAGDLVIPIIKKSLKYLNVGYKDECCNETFCPVEAPCQQSSNANSSVIVNSDFNANLQNNIILVNATASNITIILPSVLSAVNKIYHVKKIDSSSNDVIIEGFSSELIDGQLNKTINTQHTNYQLYSNGVNWFIL